MNDSRKISYQSLKEKLSDNQLKRIIAGSSGGGEGDCNLKCTNDPDRPDANIWVYHCPSIDTVESVCLAKVGFYGEYISCAGPSHCHG